MKYVKKYQKTSENFKEYLSSSKSQIRRKAQAKVNNSIKLGKITRQPCEICGAEEAEAHHSDYHEEKWLDVQWLCKKHHLEWHKKNKPLYPFS